MSSRDRSVSSSRRRFLQCVGLGAAMTALPLRAQETSPVSQPEGQAKKLKLGLASYTTKDFSLDETIGMAKRVGLEYLCLKSFHLPLEASPEEIAAAADKVRKAGLILYGGGVIGMSNEAQVNQAFEYARAAGMTTIVGVPAPEVLPLVNEKVKQYDIRVAIHNHGPGDKTYPTPESAYEKIKDLDGRIGLCIDVGHTLRIGADPVQDIRRFRDRLLDLHIKDVSAASAKGQTIEIGRGVLDIPGVLRALLEIDYPYVASFEFEKDPKDPLAGLAESVGYVRGVWAML